MNQNNGQAFLALVFLIGGVVVAIGVTLAFLTNSFVDTSYGYRASVQAEAAATSGVQDALLQIDRNPNFSNAGGYSLAVGSSTIVTVKVTKGTTSTVIVSTATISNRTKTLSATILLNSSTSQPNIISWQATQ